MAVCASCALPLTHTLDYDSDSDSPNDNPAETVPDDVHLPCNDHFHWECLLDAYTSPTCPACHSNITTPQPSTTTSTSPQPQILVTLTNEGGTQPHLDIHPLLLEEAHLRSHPSERKSRAFLEFCREGDHRAIVDLLQSCNNPSPSAEEKEQESETPPSPSTLRTNPLAGPSASPSEILRYRDPLNNWESGLHAAAANGHREVAWLLLLLASSYPEVEFPALVFQEAAALGMMREDQKGKVDIRALRDGEGRTAEDVAVREGGVVWNGWVGVGRLSMP